MILLVGRLDGNQRGTQTLARMLLRTCDGGFGGCSKNAASACFGTLQVQLLIERISIRGWRATLFNLNGIVVGEGG